MYIHILKVTVHLQTTEDNFILLKGMESIRITIVIFTTEGTSDIA
jgi:hypothetical protein